MSNEKVCPDCGGSCPCCGFYKDEIDDMKIIAIKDMSAGNDTVGEMWQETKIFTTENKLIDVMRWVGHRKKVVLTIPDNYEHARVHVELE